MNMITHKNHKWLWGTMLTDQQCDSYNIWFSIKRQYCTSSDSTETWSNPLYINDWACGFLQFSKMATFVWRTLYGQRSQALDMVQ